MQKYLLVKTRTAYIANQLTGFLTGFPILNNHWHNFSTVTGVVLQQSQARFFNSRWHDSSTVSGMTVQQLLARLFKSHWHDCSTVTGTIVHQSLA